MDNLSLLNLAKKAANNAYVPYSDFKVGAALLAESGKVYTGCNIENSSFSATICAERTALCKAVSEGERSFKALAVCAFKGNTEVALCYPCGVCRQTLSEFCKGDMTVIFSDVNGGIKIIPYGELFCFPFTDESMG